jgi:hypothetical protein
MPARLHPVFVGFPEDRIAGNLACKQVLARHLIDCKRLLAMLAVFSLFLLMTCTIHPTSRLCHKNFPNLVHLAISLRSERQMNRPNKSQLSQALTQAQEKQFLRHVFVKLENAFPKAVAKEAHTILWRESGCDPVKSATCTHPVRRIGGCAQEPFRDVAPGR